MPKKKGSSGKTRTRKARQTKTKSGRKTKAVVRARDSPTIGAFPGTDSYEEAMLHSIMHGANEAVVDEDAVIFSEILSNLTKSMKLLTYRFGIGVGRELYRTLNSAKRYYWYEEAIPDLVYFIEKSGYSNTAYSLAAKGVRIKIYNKGATFVGANLHTFESGLISGFLSAASRQVIHVNEENCANNGYDYCEFAASAAKEGAGETDMGAVIENFVRHLKSAIYRKRGQKRGRMPSTYHALTLSPLLNRKYSAAINNIAEHMGYELGSYVFDDKRASPRKIADCISKTASLLDFGEPSIKDYGKIDMRFSFSHELSRREYVNLSLSFMNGIASRAEIGKSIYSIAESRNGRYMLHIKEKR